MRKKIVSVTAINWATSVEIEHSPSKFVLVILANMANGQGECWPTHKTICAQTSLSQRCVETCIARLEAMGLIQRTARHSKNGGRAANLYTVNVGALPMEPTRTLAPCTGNCGHDSCKVTCQSVAEQGSFDDALASPAVTPPAYQNDPSRTSVGEHYIEPSMNHQIEPTTRASAPCADADLKFEEFWEAFPKRAGGNSKKAAKQRFLSAIKRKVDPDQIIGAARVFNRYCERKGLVRTEKVPMAETWLNKERWNDEMVEATQSFGFFEIAAGHDGGSFGHRR